MKPTLPNSVPEIIEQPGLEEAALAELEAKVARERAIARLRLLWQQRQFLMRVAWCSLLASTLLAFLIPNRYESAARIMPPDTQSASGLAMLASVAARASGLGNGLGGFGGDLLGLKSSSALFVGILRSRTVEDRLIERFDLKRVYRIWPIGQLRIEDARDELEGNTKISEDRKNGIITVTVTDKNAQRATAMAQAYLKELDRLVAEVTTSAARREREFLERRLQVVKQELDQASVDFSQFASKNAAIDIKEQGKAMVEAAAILQGQLIAAQTELEGLKQVFTDNNVRVRAARARIQELQRQLEKLGGKDAALASVSGQEAEPLYPSIRKLPLLGVTYFDLLRRTKIAEVVYELLTQQYELAKVEEAKEIPTVKILDIPVLPEKKSFPPRLFFISLGLLLGMIAGTAWTLCRESWVIAHPQDPRKILAVEILTALRPYISRASGDGAKTDPVKGTVWRIFQRLRNKN